MFDNTTIVVLAEVLQHLGHIIGKEDDAAVGGHLHASGIEGEEEGLVPDQVLLPGESNRIQCDRATGPLVPITLTLQRKRRRAERRRK